MNEGRMPVSRLSLCDPDTRQGVVRIPDQSIDDSIRALDAQTCRNPSRSLARITPSRRVRAACVRWGLAAHQMRCIATTYVMIIRTNTELCFQCMRGSLQLAWPRGRGLEQVNTALRATDVALKSCTVC